MDNYMEETIQDSYKFWFSMNYIYSKWAKLYGFSSNELIVIFIINEAQGNCTQKMICEKMDLPKQTVNAVLNSLEKRNLIKRISNVKDKRSKWITFTEEKTSYINKLLKELNDFEKNAFKNFDKDTLINLINTHSSLTNELFISTFSYHRRNNWKQPSKNFRRIYKILACCWLCF